MLSNSHPEIQQPHRALPIVVSKNDHPTTKKTNRRKPKNNINNKTGTKPQNLMCIVGTEADSDSD